MYTETKNNKHLQLWEFLVVLLLEIVLFSTMFIPFFHLNKNVAEKMYTKMENAVIKGAESMIDKIVDKVPAGELLSGLAGFSKDEVVKELKDQMDNDADDFVSTFEEINVSVSPITIMTNDLIGTICKITGSERPDPEEEAMTMSVLQPAVGGYNLLRVLAFIIYIFDLLLIILTILTFCIKFNKMILGILSALYGGFLAAVLGFIRFFGISIAVKKSVDQLGGLLGGALDFMGDFKELESLAPGLSDTIEKAMNKLLGKVIGVACNSMITFSVLLQILIGFALFVMGVVIIINSVKKAAPAYDQFGGQDDWGQPYGGDMSGNMNSGEWGSQNAGSFGDSFGDTASSDDWTGQAGGFGDSTATATTEGTFTSGVTQGGGGFASVATGQIFCTKGNAAGRSISIPGDKKVIVGKSQTRANFVIDYPHVSNVHCSICFNPSSNTFTVKDHSTNGTFVNGQRLPKEQPVNLQAGSVLSLADGYNQITLGKGAGGGFAPVNQGFAPQPVNQGFAPQAANQGFGQGGGGMITGVTGVSSGRSIQIPAGASIVIGKSQQRAQFIVDNPHVSNVHCLVTYNPANNTYTVVDQSSNGTQINGVPMAKNTPQVVTAGTILSLADANNQVRLG